MKVAQFSFGMILVNFFPKNATFKLSLMSNDEQKKNHPFLNSTYQECMIFARIGDGPCYYHWNEICTGVGRNSVKDL